MTIEERIAAECCGVEADVDSCANGRALEELRGQLARVLALAKACQDEKAAAFDMLKHRIANNRESMREAEQRHGAAYEAKIEALSQLVKHGDIPAETGT